MIEDEFLKCPSCGCDNIHQKYVTVGIRDETEDCPGTITYCIKKSVTSKRVEDKDFSNFLRRDFIKIDFRCEQCEGIQNYYYLIYQHKGFTLMEWKKKV